MPVRSQQTSRSVLDWRVDPFINEMRRWRCWWRWSHGGSGPSFPSALRRGVRRRLPASNPIPFRQVSWPRLAERDDNWWLNCCCCYPLAFCWLMESTGADGRIVWRIARRRKKSRPFLHRAQASKHVFIPPPFYFLPHPAGPAEWRRMRALKKKYIRVDAKQRFISAWRRRGPS